MTAELESVGDPGRAAVLMDPLRRQVLAAAREPASASAIADRLGLGRQRVNYHVRALAKAGFLRRAGTRRKRNLVEQRYVATARSFVLAPEILGPLAADPRRITDPLSANHLLALGAQLTGELSESIRQATDADQRLSTLSIGSAFRFESPGQRAEFARALRDVIADVVARFTSPDTEGAKGRPYRLVLGCYPIPKDDDEQA